MIAISHKTKQFLLVTVKILIVTFAFLVIYRDLQHDKNFDFNAFSKIFNLKTAFFLLGLTLLNWFFEILKWQNLVSSVRKISFFEAAAQSLGSLTASIFTPNRIGEYAAKVLYYPKENRKKVILLNFLSNFCQMLTTCFFGVLALIFVGLKFDLFELLYFNKTIFVLTILLFVGLILVLFFARKIEIYGFSISKMTEKIKSLPKNLVNKTFAFSTIRYLLFSHQFYFILIAFGSQIPYFESLLIIFSMYLVASIIPTIHLFDVVIKGSVALFLFKAFKADFYVTDWMIVSTSTLMWLLNLVFPAIIGSYFVLKFKPYKI